MIENRSGTTTPQTDSSRTRISPVGVVWALVFAVVAAIGITGGQQWLLRPSTLWIGAGVLVALGVLSLLLSLTGSGAQDDR